MIRRPIRNINNPLLQEALIIQKQRNPNAAISGMLGRNLYGDYAAKEGGKEVALNDFARRHALSKRKMADKKEQHTLLYNQKYKSLKDAKKGAKFAKYLGLGQLGLGFMGNRAAKKDRELVKQWRLNMMEQYAKNKYRNSPYAYYGHD
jgi:hypothetical protein